MLCQLSPKLRIASGQKFALLSRAANGRSPIVWQIELIDQVTWCSRNTRTSDAQKKADSAAPHDRWIAPAIAGGSSSDSSSHTGKSLSTKRMSLSPMRSGVYLSRLVCISSNIQPRWAQNSPFISAPVVSP